MPTKSSGARRSKGATAFVPKDRIDHAVFGLGTILEIDARRTTIAFDEVGTKTFVTSLVKLAVSDTPAPARRGRAKPAAKKAAKKAAKPAAKKAAKPAAKKASG